MSVTIKDVARLARVGVSTVSRAMNQSGYVSADALERIKAAVEELGYRPDPTARALIRRRTDMVALIVDVPLNEAWDTVVTHLENELFNEKLISSVFILSYMMPDWQERFRTVVETIQERRMAGLIFMGGDMYGSDEEIYDRLIRTRFPMVGIDCYMPGSIVVSSDHEGGTRTAARHLLGLGHKSIGFLRPNDDAGSMSRQLGWKKALLAAGIDPPDSWVVKTEVVTPKSALDACLPVLQRPDRPTGFVCFNDELALGLIHAAWRLGIKVPEELSVVGYDDTPSVQAFIPPLTTMKQHSDRLARLAVDELMNCLQGRESVAGTRMIDSTLVIRNTTATPYR